MSELVGVAAGTFVKFAPEPVNVVAFMSPTTSSLLAGLT